MKEITIDDEGDLVEIVEPAENDLHLEKAQAGVLGGLAQIEVFGLPIGKTVGAMAIVGLVDAVRGLVSGMLPEMVTRNAWVIPAGMAWLMSTRQVQGWTGKQMADAAGLILLVDAFQASPFSPRTFVSGLLSGVKLGQTTRGTVATGGNGRKEITSLEEYNRVYGLA